MSFFNFFKTKKPQLPQDANDAIKKIAIAAFPGGYKQIEKETGQLYSLLRGKVNQELCKEVLTKTKSLLIISEDNSCERVVPYIIDKSKGKLTLHEAKLAYLFFTGMSGELYSGGDGKSENQAIGRN